MKWVAALALLLMTASGCSHASTGARTATVQPYAMSLVERGYVVDLVVDASRGVEYGVDQRGIFRLDAHLHLTRLFPNLHRRHSCLLALDPSAGRLAIGALRIDHPGQGHTLKGLRVTNLAQLLNLPRRRLLVSVPVGHLLVGMCGLGNPTAIAVDASLHHAFILDNVGPLNGRWADAVMLDTVHSRVVCRFRVPRIEALFGLVAKPLVVDERTHRLFIGLSDSSGSSGGSVVVLNTRTGRVVRLVQIRDPVWGLSEDIPAGKVVADGMLGDGYLLDARSGRMIHPVRQNYGFTLQAVAVDALTHHAFLVVQEQAPGCDPACSRFRQEILMVDDRSGRVLRRMPGGSEDQFVDLAADGMGHLYYTDEAGLWVFDAATGKVIQHVRAGKLKDAGGYRLALDPAHGRLFLWGLGGVLALTQGKR